MNTTGHGWQLTPAVAWLEDENGGYYATLHPDCCEHQPMFTLKDDDEECLCGDEECAVNSPAMHLTTNAYTDPMRWWL